MVIVSDTKACSALLMHAKNTKALSICVINLNNGSCFQKIFVFVFANVELIGENVPDF